MELDTHVPGERWEFNEDVAKKFDDMLDRSIPGYPQMRDLVYRLGSRFVTNDSMVVDLGASRGEASSRFIENFPAAEFTLMEVSEAMLGELGSRFKSNSNVAIFNYDLRNSVANTATFLTRNARAKNRNIDLVLSILTLVFVPINYRPSVIQAVFNSMNVGGAFIVVEKELGNSAFTQELLVDTYHEYKHDRGYSWEDIERKRLALEGVQVPVSTDTNKAMLEAAGFKVVECFWRHLNFCGYIAMKV